MRVNLWAELPSPVKTSFREAFRRYSQEVYARSRIILRGYIPAGMGAQMPVEDYLLRMPEAELPDCYLTMAFGECSTPAFAARFLNSGIYEQPEVFCFFPELMVVDRRRLGDRPIPKSYEDLADPVYRGELCLIGNRGKPDPLLPLYLYERRGEQGMREVLQNVQAIAGPSSTIRHIGRTSNRFGSVFVMPALFARVCEERPHTSVICPTSGALAEPILLFWRHDVTEEKKTLLRSFLEGTESASVMQAARFPVPAHPRAEDVPIDAWCRTKLLYPERYFIPI